MILISLSNELYASSLEKELEKLCLPVHRLTDQELAPLVATLTQNYSCVVVDEQAPHIAGDVWSQLLKGWAARTKVLIYPTHLAGTAPGHHNTDQPTKEKEDNAAAGDDAGPYIKITTAAGELATFIQHHLGPSQFLGSRTAPIRYGHLEQLLTQDKLLYTFYIDGSQHHNIYTEYGLKVHTEFHRVFEDALYKAIQATAALPPDPLVYNKDSSSNIYYIFCSLKDLPDETSSNMDFSALCYSLYTAIKQHLKDALAHNHIFKDLVHFHKKLSSFSVGYSSTLYNPCFNLKAQLKSTTARARTHALMLHHHIRASERNFLMKIMTRDDLLQSKYQAIFKITDFGPDDIAAAHARDYHKLADKIYGFEALVRTRPDNIKPIQNQWLAHINPHELNPAELFTLAYQNNLSLELDQKCIQLAIKNSEHLSGILLVNIFPRNFYYIDKLSHNIPKHTKITFELSEDKLIKNSSFLLEARSKLCDMNFKIATDDVSSGFSNLKRLIALRPDLIKLDRALIHRADEDQRKQSLIKIFVEYARSFACQILVEGVERQGEFELCQQLGIQYVQGFYLHKPDAIDAIIREFGSPSAATSTTPRLTTAPAHKSTPADNDHPPVALKPCGS